MTIDRNTYLMFKVDFEQKTYKIGKSKNITRRLKELNQHKTKEPYETKLLCIIKGDIEKELHNEYIQKRLNGEWFYLEENDIKNILMSYSDIIINTTEEFMCKLQEIMTYEDVKNIINSNIAIEIVESFYFNHFLEDENIGELAYLNKKLVNNFSYIERDIAWGFLTKLEETGTALQCFINGYTEDGYVLVDSIKVDCESFWEYIRAYYEPDSCTYLSVESAFDIVIE